MCDRHPISTTFYWRIFSRLQRCNRAFPVDKTRAPSPVFEIIGDVRRLIIRPGAIGDFIVSLPALECLTGNYVEVWTAPAIVPLARFADRARSIPSTGLDLLGITDAPARLLEELRSFDSIVSWYGANRAEFVELVSDLRLPFTFFPALPTDGVGVHATDFYLRQVGTLVTVVSDGIPRIACDVVRERFAVIHPFSGSARKNWPLERFRELARELEREMPVRWCSGPEDPPLADAVRFHDLYELACWLASASLYVGNDSGITHLAAAVGTPVLALFGPTDPVVWAPRGPHVQVGRWHED
jgi:lipopolysaccharide heptosyltransferase III